MEQSQLDTISEISRIAEDILFSVYDHAVAGVSTFELNEMAKKKFKEFSVVPATRFTGYKKEITIGLNDEIFYGDISKKKVLRDNDLVHIGLGIFNKGFFTDVGISKIIGEGSPEKKMLLIATARSLYKATMKIKPGLKVEDIAKVFEDYLKSYGFTPVASILSHGVGHCLYQPPFLPTCLHLPFVDYKKRFEENQIMCLEPVASKGNGKIVRNSLKIKTKDKSPAAYFELPVLLTDNKALPLAMRIFKHVENLTLFGI